VAGIGIGQRIDKFVSLPTNAYGTAVTTFAGQNLGAGNRARIREGIKDSIILSLATTITLGLIMYPSASFIARMFNRNPEVIETAVLMNHIMMPLYFLIAIRHIMIGVLRAHKRNRLSTFLTLAGMVGVRQIYLAVVMNIKSDIVYVIWGYPVGWFFAFLFVAIYYFGCRKKMFSEKTADLQ
jgi:Na+-driven multidrug efflux pump